MNDRFEVVEQRVQWGNVPPEWRDEIDMPTAEERVKYPYPDRRWVIVEVMPDESGEIVDMFGREHEAVAACKRRNAEAA